LLKVEKKKPEDRKSSLKQGKTRRTN